jgi:hypothetical protein
VRERVSVKLYKFEYKAEFRYPTSAKWLKKAGKIPPFS